MKHIHLPILCLLLFFAVSGCEKKTDEIRPVTDARELQGFWKSKTGLHYLDLSGRGPISLVLPSHAGTLSPQARVQAESEGLAFIDGEERFVLELQGIFPGQGENRCIKLDNTRLCHSERD